MVIFLAVSNNDIFIEKLGTNHNIHSNIATWIYGWISYLWEEEKVAQDFISKDGSERSNSNISREALVLNVASNCWADVPTENTFMVTMHTKIRDSENHTT